MEKKEGTELVAFDSIRSLSKAEAKARVNAMLSDPSTLGVKPIDPQTLARVKSRIPTDVYDVWGRFGSFESEDPVAFVGPDEMDPELDEPGVICIGTFGEVMHLAASLSDDSVFEVWTETGMRDRLNGRHPSIYHWILSMRPDLVTPNSGA